MSSYKVAMAGEPKATFCGDVAKKAALALFEINVGMTPKTKVTQTLVDMSHGEPGFEVWDFLFDENGFKYSPYRITTSDEGCIITDFSMPSAS